MRILFQAEAQDALAAIQNIKGLTASANGFIRNPS